VPPPPPNRQRSRALTDLPPLEPPMEIPGWIREVWPPVEEAEAPQQAEAPRPQPPPQPKKKKKGVFGWR